MSKIILPPYLKPGDAVGIVATARKISREELSLGIKTIEQWGFKPVLGKYVFESDHQFSGTDAQRAEDLQNMLDNPEIKAVISGRGGYGTAKIIDRINFDTFIKNPKWIIGYSDLTVLHSHIHQYNVATLHATMPINFGLHPEATASLGKALKGEKLEYHFHAHAFNRNGNSEGIIVGGNLSLLLALNNTPSDIDTKNKILFIEDLDEYLYHLDRTIQNLKRSGKLSELKALVVGGLSEMKDNPAPFGKTAEEIIFDAVKAYKYPVYFNFPAGHIDNNFAIKLGAGCKIICEGEKIIFTQL